LKKHIIIPVLLIVCSQLSLSQEFEKGKHYKVPELDRFVGEWKGITNGDTIVISLKKGKVYIEGVDIFMDQIFGNYTSSLNVDNSKGQTILYSISKGNISGVKHKEKRVLNFVFYDRTNLKPGKGRIHFLNKNTIEWFLQEKEPAKIKRLDSSSKIGFSIPKDIILKRVIKK